MSERKGAALLAGFVLAASLIAAALSAAWTAGWLERAQFHALSAVCERVAEARPDAEVAVLDALREQSRRPGRGAEFLAERGYEVSDFSAPVRARVFLPAIAGALAGAALFALCLAARRRGRSARIRALAEYLEGVNAGDAGALLPGREDEFSLLRDEIYKTVSSLRQTRDDALAARRRFADNLCNIAHQLKTPITSLSLAVQARRGREQAGEMEGQLARLTRLEEALLLLARVDAGTLPLAPREVDAFTALTLAADQLRALCRERRVAIEIPELGEARIYADLEWTMEALLNLMKNCVEHAPAGSAVHCRYERNPLYARIQIWDEGPGFSPRDIPHLFERFYRGEGAAPGGMGVGLALAREILEMQNGSVWAENRPGGGARFEVRFYCHGTVTFA